jgi:hypothetical protein
MSIKCDIILPFTALGAALWRWCTRAAGETGIYQYLDNQALADLIAGKLPAPGRAVRQTERGVHLGIRDDVSHDRQGTIDSLRREMPAEGIEDILIEGQSWVAVDSKGTASVPALR